MYFPAIIVAESTTCERAKNHLIHHNINTVIITEEGIKKISIANYITFQISEKVLFHGLGDVRVHEYLMAEFDFYESKH